VGSIRFDGVRSVAYPQDHDPVHVHGFYAEIEVIVQLTLGDRTVNLAERYDAIRPGNAKRADVRHILEVAAAHFEELMELWRKAHA